VETAEIFSDLQRALQGDLEGALVAAGRLVSFLTEKAAAETSSDGSLASWQKRKIRDYIADRLHLQIHVEDLASHVALSSSHFCRLFKQSYGETVHAHIMRLRLELAQHLMLTTNNPLSHVALDCGLSDQAHLTKLFRRCLGATPSAWRRLNLREAPANERACAKSSAT
jgi:AraC-like DNA-binding protein